MEETLQFLIMINCDKSRDEMLNHILDCFDEAEKRKANSCDLRENWIEIWQNDDFDAELSADELNGYLHFRWRLEATPLKDDVAVDGQVVLAKEITACFEQTGCQCIVCANFEDLL